VAVPACLPICSTWCTDKLWLICLACDVMSSHPIKELNFWLTCRRQHTVLLTGTPMQNDLHELYALLSYLHPRVFTDSAPFDDAFDLTNHKVSRSLQLFCTPCRQRSVAMVHQ
jgi:SNF2-related domain